MAKLQKEKLIDTIEVTEVSRETGEVVTYTKNVYDKQIHDENVSYLLSEKELHVFIDDEIGKFFFYFYKKMDKVNIEEQYKVRFLYLSSYLDYNSDYIVSKDGNRKTNISYDGLRSILNLSIRECRNTIKAFEENNLIKKEKNGYRLNTEYCFRGVGGTIKNCSRVFIDTVRELYLETLPRHHKQLYFFFKLLPYINMQHNVITKDVKEENIHNIKPLSMGEIALILGSYEKNPKKLFEILSKFQIKGESIICLHKIKGVDLYSVNPRVFYRGTQIDNLKALLNIFDMAKNRM